MIKKYRKKPIVVEAIIWNGHNINEIHTFTDNASKVQNRRMRIKTLGGALWADDGDYIVKDINGECYPCKPDIFTDSYTQEVADHE